MELLNVLTRCMDLDQKMLEQPSAEGLPEDFVKMHLSLAAQLEKAEEAEIHALSVSDEAKQQMLSEKMILPLAEAKGDYEVVTLMTTFSCYYLSRRRGDPKHSGKYMRDVRRLHEMVNVYYGKDPETARGCS